MPSRKQSLNYLIAAAIFLAVIAEGLHTIRALGPSRDQPVYFHIANSYLSWFKNLGDGSAFSEAVLDRIFGLGFHNFSPSLAKLMGALTQAAFSGVMGKFWAFRMYAPILFGLLMALIYSRGRSAWGRSAALACVLCAFFMPRLFGDGHIGATEAPLCFFWFLTAITFGASLDRPKIAPLAGLCFGLAMSVKFTGFFLPVPLLAWPFLPGRKRRSSPHSGFFCSARSSFFCSSPRSGIIPWPGPRNSSA